MSQPLFEARLSFSKETKGTWVYKHDGHKDDAVGWPISTLYISKDAMPIAASEITVTVSV